MMSAANSRPSRSSQQEFDRAEPVLLLAVWLQIIFAVRAHDSRSPRFSGSLRQKLAVQGRYKVDLFLCVLTGSLQGVAERPLPCSYNVIPSVIALSRRKRGFKSSRGRHTFNDLHAKALGYVYRTSLLEGSTDCSLVSKCVFLNSLHAQAKGPARCNMPLVVIK